LSVYDSYMDTMPEKKKRIRIDGTSGAQKGFERRARTKESFLDSIELPAPLRPHLELVDPEVRGRLRP
ncbi:MAG: hypothetical protein Q8P48_03640, partial [Deltaproteobacteria bacterium]|nr:hypothetical protein [Deltaproteobacteria bacterium]